MLIDEPEISKLVRRDKKFVVTKFRPHKPHRAANRDVDTIEFLVDATSLHRECDLSKI